MVGIRIPESFPAPAAGKLNAEGQKAPNTAIQSPESGNQNQLLERTPETTQSRSSATPEIFRQTAANLGFPQDTLSVALLVFARYFSLPIKPALIGQLRREFLNTGKTSATGESTDLRSGSAIDSKASPTKLSPQTAGEKAALDSESMAAVIAADKGLSLNSDALLRYAAFLLPPLFGDKKENADDSNDKEDAPESDEVRAIAEEEEQKDDFLALLNSIPGKNGQYWMVFPFSVKVRGIDLNVFLRFLKREHLAEKDGDQLILDVSGLKRQWRCFLKKTSGKFRANILVYPEYNPKELGALQKEAERLFGSSGDISIQNGDKIPSWAEDLSTLCLPSIDKNV